MNQIDNYQQVGNNINKFHDAKHSISVSPTSLLDLEADTQETNCMSSKTDTEERKDVKSGDESMAEHDRRGGKVPSSRDDYVSHHLLNSRSKTNRDPKAA